MPEVKKFLGTTNTGDLSALGSDQQREFSNVKYLLNNDDLVKYFAVPSKNEDNEKIDWYSDAEGQIKRFSKFDEQEIEEVRYELSKLKVTLQELSQRVQTPLDRSSILNLCTIPRIEESVLKVGDQLVLINWSYLLRAQKNKPQVIGSFGGLASTCLELSADKELKEPVDENPAEPMDKNPAETVDESPAEPVANNPAQPVIESPTEPVNETLTKRLDASDQKQEPDRRANYWLWMAVFLLVLLLNVLMLKDACGIKYIPFLFFC